MKTKDEGGEIDLTRVDSDSSEEEQIANGKVINQNSKQKERAKWMKLRKEFAEAKAAAIEIDKFREKRLKELEKQN